MNQTVTANISGIVYHIDVDAYEKLNAYLDKIKSYFSNSEESAEIMTDIEARIAELLNARLSNENQVVSVKDVEEVMEVMGRPEQYIDEEEQEKRSQSNAGQKRRTTTTRSPRRLFRDPDDRVLGGVASGIAAYLGIDPVWLRLLFIVILLMGFGFLFYIILWIIIPEARTSAEKLQMRGEPVNIENIGRSFEEGANRVNERIKDMDGGQIGKGIESFLQSFFNVMTTLLRGLFKAVGKLLGFAFVLIGLFLAVVFIGSLLHSNVVYGVTSSGIFSFESYEFFGTLFSSELQYTLASIGLMLVLGIPILGLLLGGIKLLFNVRNHFGIGVGLAVLWFIGLSISALIAIQIAMEFKSEYEVHEIQVVEGEFDQIILNLDEEDFPGDHIINVEGDDFFLTMDDSNIYYGYPTLDVRKSKGDSAYVKITRTSYGPTKKESIENAKDIDYQMEQKENMLLFSPYISIDRGDRIRGQQVEIVVYIPEGMTIFLDESTEPIIYDIDNVTDTWDRDMLGENWIMLKDGLTCLDCEEINGISADDLEY